MILQEVLKMLSGALTMQFSVKTYRCFCVNTFAVLNVSFWILASQGFPVLVFKENGIELSVIVIYSRRVR